MKTFYKIIILVAIGLASISISMAQGLNGKFNINISAGLSKPVNGNINCEYQITNNSYISLGYGEIATLGGATPHIDITHFFLKGNNNHYFEYGYGVAAFDHKDDIVVLPNFRLGYRKMNDYNSKFFRTGISLVEGIYFGIGRSF